MSHKLEEVINNPYGSGSYKDKNLKIDEKIHAYMFVYDSSNKRTFDSMLCMLETIQELEKAQKRGAGTK